MLLGCECSYSVDTWSVALVIAEAALGLALLPGESEYNQLKRMEILLGPPPNHLILSARRAALYELV